ncbi:taurine ABC transporter substrate-binding protein [Corynebacterium sp. AOP40-9SA-29]|uniref:taurine ABC transporter substrate-binding protein n=1 Tax=Corynebacterium sp. AOP40-9SA-29 TaxID=3457677 RepID=UPI0040349587
MNATKNIPSTRRTRRTAAALVGLATVMATSACVGPPASNWATQNNIDCPVEPDESVTTSAVLGYQMIPNGDAIVQNQRLLETCMPNADIEWTRFDSAGDILQAYGAGSIDYGLLGSAGLARAVSAPLNLDLVTPWVFDEIGEAESLVVKDPEIESIRDLRGKSIAVTYSSTSHYSLLGALDQAGMTAGRDVTLINLAPDRMLAGWQSDELDAAFVWDPTLSALTESGHVITSAKESADGGAPTYDMATFTRGFVDDNPEFMAMWATVQDEATRQIAEDTDRAAGSIAVVLGLEAETVQRQLQGYRYPRAEEQASAEMLGDSDGQGDLGGLLYDTAAFLKDNREIDAVGDPSTYAATLHPDAAIAAAETTDDSEADDDQ